jgi:hypothetical protein
MCALCRACTPLQWLPVVEIPEETVPSNTLCATKATVIAGTQPIAHSHIGTSVAVWQMSHSQFTGFKPAAYTSFFNSARPRVVHVLSTSRHLRSSDGATKHRGPR